MACAADEVADCRGICWNETYVDWADDGSCDDGAYGPDWNCPAFGCDRGECGACGSGATEPVCWVLISQSHDATEWILGAPFLRAFYVAFDVAAGRVETKFNGSGRPKQP